MAERSFLDKLWKPDEDRMAGPVNLDAIGYVESRNLPGFMMIPKDAMKFVGQTANKLMNLGNDDVGWATGEEGKFQITPPMYKDLQQKMPEKYGMLDRTFVSYIDPLAEGAAKDYIGLLQNRYAPHYGYAPTAENLAAGYNMGPKGPIKTAPKAIKKREKYQRSYKKALAEVNN